MRKSHFAAIDDAIAHALDERQDVVVPGIEDEFVERGFEGV